MLFSYFQVYTILIRLPPDSTGCDGSGVVDQPSIKMIENDGPLSLRSNAGNKSKPTNAFTNRIFSLEPEPQPESNFRHSSPTGRQSGQFNQHGPRLRRLSYKSGFGVESASLTNPRRENSSQC